MSSCQTDGGDVTIRLLKEDILRVKADVCVTSIHRSKDMKNGVLSSQILHQAGREIQTEADKINSGKDMEHGQVEELSACKLSSQFKKLLTVCLYHWRPGNDKVLERAVAECLTLANALDCESIVFPALGMGGLGYPADLVARAIMSTIVNYRALHPESKLTTFMVTLYHKKDDDIKAFFQASKKFFEEHEQTKGGASLDASEEFHQMSDLNENTTGQNQGWTPPHPPSSSPPPTRASRHPPPLSSSSPPTGASKQSVPPRQQPQAPSTGPQQSKALPQIWGGVLSIVKSLTSGLAISGKIWYLHYKVIPDFNPIQKSVGIKFEIHFKLS